ERRRTADVVVQQRVELGAEARALAGLDPRVLQLQQRRHQRFWHVLAPIGTEAVLDRAHGAATSCAPAAAGAGGGDSASGPVDATASAKALIFAGSLRPGASS